MDQREISLRTELEARLRFETLLADLSARFINLPAEKVDDSIVDAQRQICECLGLDVSTLWQWSDKSCRYFRMTHYYRALEGPPVPERFDASELFPWNFSKVLAGQVIIVRSLEELPPEASRDLEIWRYYGIKSNLSFPLSAGGGPLVGTLAFCTMREEHSWPDALVKRLQLVAQLFSNAIARKQSELALQEAKAQLSLAAQSAGATLWSLDPVSNLFWVSEGGAKMFPLPSDQGITLETLMEIAHPEDRQGIRDAIQRVLDCAEHVKVDYRVVFPNGMVRWFSSRGNRQPSPDGKGQRVMGVTVDITDRKEIELALAESERRYRVLFESAPEGIALIGTDGCVRAANAVMARLWGYESAGQLLGRYAPLFVAERDRGRSALVMGEQLRGRTMPAPRRYTMVRRDGSEFIGEVTSAPLAEPGQEPNAYLCLTRDVTTLVRADEAMHASERKFRTLHESMMDAFVSVDMEGRIRECNAVYQQMLGYSEGELCQLTYQDLTPQRWHAGETELIRNQVLKRGYSDIYEKEYRKKDGTVFPVELHTFLTRDEDGQPSGMWAIVRDITERKRDQEALLQSLTKIKELKDRLQAESDYLKAEIKVTQSHGEIVGQSRAIQQVLHQVEQVAPTDSTVLITGETGTGKELIARAIHRLSLRKDRLMVMVNCAALPGSLVESELFGREKGAFTGSLMRQAGRFELADNSTIFLDEVGELPLELQAKLLRVLQSGEFERLGSSKTLKVNVRLVAATNRDLVQEVRKGRFREDLFYRLNVFPIRVPPLRERSEDIPLLVWAFVRELCARMGRNITKVPRKTMAGLQAYKWPGNIRELRNVVEHGVIITSGEVLQITAPTECVESSEAPLTLAESEREHILEVLERTDWRIKGPNGAAQRLGLKPSTLYTRMEKLGIPTRRDKVQGI